LSLRSMIKEQVCKILEFDRVLELISSYAVNPGGAERVRSLGPVADAQFIEDEFNRLAEMISIAGGEANFKPPEIPVLTEQMARLTKPGVVLEAAEIVSFGRLFEAAGSVKSYILRREDSLPCLSLLAGRINPFSDLQREINRIFEENAEVKSSASPLLAKLRKDVRVVRERIEKKLLEITERLKEEGSAGENFITLRQERYVLAILRSEMHDCPGIIQGESASGNTLFIEPEQVVNLNNRFREIELDIRREINRILAELSARLAANRDQIQTNIEILTEIDSLFARACYAQSYDCHRPILSRNKELLLKNARHPLLLARQSSQAQPVVELNLELGDGERTLLVSGPNAGGKTVLLKTVGLVALMTQSGIFPPLDEGSRLPVFESILTAIGDEQSIDKDLSTFTAHVRDLKESLELGTPRSLVLLDEVGVGTDPAEGAALAAAVLEHLTGLGCLTLCTTHYGELKLLHEKIEGLVNGSLEFDTHKMRPTFVFHKGIPGRSYGLAIARNVGLDESLLERAGKYMTGHVVDINEYLARLQDLQKKLNTELEGVQEKKRQLQEKLEALSAEKAQVDRLAEELKAREKDFESRMAERERQRLLKARKEVEQVIRRLESEYSRKPPGAAAKEARKAVEDKIRKLKEAGAASGRRKQEQAAKSPVLRPGDQVRVAGLDLVGEVVEGPNGSGRYTVVAGRARLTLPAEELIPLGRRKVRKKQGACDLSSVETLSGESVVSDKLDLRGMRSDEIGRILDGFLSAAEMAGLGQVVLVHGKGTGALRAKVAEFLSADHRVESFRPGAWNEGGTGATIVNLVQ